MLEFSKGVRSKIHSYKEYCEEATYTVLSVTVWHSSLPKILFKSNKIYEKDTDLSSFDEEVKVDIANLYQENIIRLGEYYNFYTNL